MPRLDNRSTLAAHLALCPDPSGIETAYLTLKATYELTQGEPRPAARQLALFPADVYFGDASRSSLRAASDLGLGKPSTDVILLGRAVSPVRTAVMDVGLAVGPVARVLRVFGDRCWRRAGGDWIMSDPEPFERMPLMWERAFGGAAPRPEGVPPVRDERNPVGCGFLAEDDEPWDGQPLPNLEDPAALMAAPHDRPPPACFGPVAPSWLARRRLAGTYDEAWRSRRAPYLPLDFDPAYFQLAPAGQVAARALEGGEAVHLRGCVAGGELSFRLPRPEIVARWDFEGGLLDCAPRLGSVFLEPDYARLQMVWWAALRVDRRAARLARASITCAEFAPAAGA